MNESLAVAKARQACEILDELGIDCWLIWVRETDQIVDPSLQFVYDGSFVWQTAILFTRDGERILIAGTLDVQGVKDELFDRIVPYDEAISERLRDVLGALDPAQIAIDVSESDVATDGMTVGMRGLLDRYLEGTPYVDRFVSAERVVARLRGRKLPGEVDRIRSAIGVTEEILDEISGRLRVGQTEIEIQRAIHEAMAERGVGHAWASDHNPAVDAGPEKELGHGCPSALATSKGNLLHFDFGVKVDGYCSDLQRMFFFGRPDEIPESVQHAFDTVLGAIDAATGDLRAGAKGHEIDGIARRHVIERGYPEYMHALGHQVGRNAHDGGLILGPRWEKYGASVDGAVEVGNVFTLELDVPVDGYGQVSLEEDVLITDSGCEFLSSPQRALICLE
ncbi:MAG: M24 family metallopeptidase [Candidatus Bipolaricaulia bacterium]